MHTLNLSHCSGLKNEDLEDFPLLTQLRSLDLSYCSRLTAKSVELIAQLPQVQKLRLVECDQLRIAEKALLEVCVQCTLLEEIDLTDTGFYIEFASELVSKMPSVKKGVILGGEYPLLTPFDVWRTSPEIALRSAIRRATSPTHGTLESLSRISGTLGLFSAGPMAVLEEKRDKSPKLKAFLLALLPLCPIYPL